VLTFVGGTIRMTMFARVGSVAACLTLSLAASGGGSVAADATMHPTTIHADSVDNDPAQRVHVTDGGNLADFEALLRQEFPSHAPCVWELRFSAARANGSCPARSTSYSYAFRFSGRSTFHLMSKRRSRPDKWLGPVSGTVVAVVRGRMVACGRKGRFGIGFFSSEGASVPVDPPAPYCALWRDHPSGGLGLNNGPWSHRKFEPTVQGLLQWNLVALLREEGYLRAGDTCFATADPRTNWNLPNDGGQETLGCGYYSIAAEFAKQGHRSYFRLGPFYDPGERIGDGMGDEPVMLNGRVVVCGSSPTRYLFGPGSHPYRLHDKTYWELGWFYAVCARPRIQHGHTPDLVASVSGSGSRELTIRRSLSVFGWRYSCRGHTPRTRSDRLIVDARQDEPSLGWIGKRYVSKGPLGERQGEPDYFGTPTHISIISRPAGAPPKDCRWHFWALGESPYGPWW
jgi:hypothetical protein